MQNAYVGDRRTRERRAPAIPHLGSRHIAALPGLARSRSRAGVLTSSEDLRFFKHLLPECRVQASLRYHLNPPAQKLLCVHEERPERQTGALRRQSDQQVDVTRLIRVSPGHRAEDADIAEAVSLCEGADLGSVGLDQGVHFENASWRRGRDALATAVQLTAADAAPSLDGMVEPTYTAEGDLIRPEGYPVLQRVESPPRTPCYPLRQSTQESGQWQQGASTSSHAGTNGQSAKQVPKGSPAASTPKRKRLRRPAESPGIEGVRSTSTARTAAFDSATPTATTLLRRAVSTACQPTMTSIEARA